MSIRRRTLLLNLCAGSVLASSGVSSWAAGIKTSPSAFTPPLKPLVHLQTGTTQDFLFNRGVQRALVENNAPALPETMRLEQEQLHDHVYLHHLLTALKGHRVMGIADDTSFCIFQLLAREQGAAFLFTGQHSWGGDDNYHSRHRLQSTNRSQGVGQALHTSLDGDRQGHLVGEHGLGTRSARKGENHNRLNKSQHWVASLGEALTIIGLDGWKSGPVGDFEQRARTPVKSDQGFLASYVIEL